MTEAETTGTMAGTTETMAGATTGATIGMTCVVRMTWTTIGTISGTT